MHIGLIAPSVIHEARSGFQLRLLQLQEILRRIAGGKLDVWDLSRGRPITVGTPVAQRLIEARTDLRSRAHPTTVLRDMVALALHLWPYYRVRSIPITDQRTIAAWCHRHQFTHVVLTHPAGTELISDLARSGRRVFVDAQNAESFLAKQLTRGATSLSSWLRAQVYWRTVSRREKWDFPHAAEIWFPSHLDIELQRRVIGDGIPMRCVPNGLDLERYHPLTRGPTSTIVMPGTFDYAPNIRGAALMKTQILPWVRQTIPDATLVLLGRDPNGSAQALADPPTVVATGEVEDVRPYLAKAGVVVAPIMEGGGTRFKILEALALGLPVVTTPLGCDGLEVRDEQHLLTRDLANFALAITSLLQKPERGQALGEAGRQLVASRYSWDAVEPGVRAALSVGV